MSTIADKLQDLIDAKADMKSAIEYRDVEVGGGLVTYADAISEIGARIGSLGYPIGKDETEYCFQWNKDENVIDATTGVWILYGAPYKDRPYENAKQMDMCYWGYPKWKIRGGQHLGAARRVFANFPNLLYVPMIDVSEADDVVGLYADCKKLRGVAGFDTSRFTSLENLFNNCVEIRNINHFDTAHITNMHAMFNGCLKLKTLPKLSVNSLVDARDMFYECESLKKIPIDFSKNAIEYASLMFAGCKQLSKIDGDFYVGHITDAELMFNGCIGLTIVPNFVGEFTQATGRGMFNGCTSLTVVNNLNMGGLVSTESMFGRCTSLKSASNLNTSDAVDMTSMFASCDNLTSVGILDTSKVKYFEKVFSYCYELEDIGGFRNLGMPLDFHDGVGQKVSFEHSDKLTKQSLLNIIYNLYDRYGNYGTGSERPIVFNYVSIDKLTDNEIAIMTNKGWIVEAV